MTFGMMSWLWMVQSGPLPVINGVITPINGLKYMAFPGVIITPISVDLLFTLRPLCMGKPGKLPTDMTFFTSYQLVRSKLM